MAVKEGKVKVVARTGGIIFEGEPNNWYNPTDDVKASVLQNKDTYKGALVEMELVEGDLQKFSKISVPGVSGEKPISDYAPASTVETQIHRQVFLKVASGMLKLSEPHEADMLAELVVKLAKAIEKECEGWL